jgi:DNA-binding winged helix-turn-helix (wHTH) protein
MRWAILLVCVSIARGAAQGESWIEVKAGKFRMGRDAAAVAKAVVEETHGVMSARPAQGDFDEDPAHEVKLTRSYRIGESEVTIAEFQRFRPGYVTKPFRIRELVARAKAFPRRYRARPGDVVKFDAFELNLTSHKLFRGGVELELTAKEFALLAFFAKRAGRALARNDILNGVWGNSVRVTQRSVDRCVTTLRAKIEKDPHDPRFIQTIRDIGYRFEIEA